MGAEIIRVTREPDAVFVGSEIGGALHAASRGSDGSWITSTAHIQTIDTSTATLEVRASSPRAGLAYIVLHWNDGVPDDSLILGDAWERSYGDLGWQHIRPDRQLPWYWLATSPGKETRGAGVHVRPAAMAFWTVDGDGVTLWLDVRSGREPVMLGDRTLDVATVTAISAAPHETPFGVLRSFCEALCSDSRHLTEPLVGANNWYYSYGANFDADAVVRDAAMIAEVAGDHDVRPFSVIDAGWSKGTSGAPGGPWTTGARTFSDMPAVAERIRNEGARPGLWVRPLLTSDRSSLCRDRMLDGEWPLDPSRDDVLDQVRTDIGRLVSWGFELIKHDFTTFDTLGHFVPNGRLRMDTIPWSFADNSRTTAEVLVDLYRAVREGAGDAIIIGCNTVGHLAAGLVEVQRTGDDTSGKQWERTRRMGINTLAFRLSQHGTFFTLDADCVPSTPLTPWEKNRQFLDLVARSGTALFVSVDPATLDSSVEADLRQAVAVALDGGDAGGVEPIDWQWTSTPKRWRLSGREREYDWALPWGAGSDLHSS